MGGMMSGDHDLLEKFLDVVLDRYKDGMISHMSARSTLAEAIALASHTDSTATRHMQAVLDQNPRDGL